MGKFFKTLGKGILYVFGLPILVVFLAVYLVISIFGFIITGFKALIMFFKGESITAKLPEDVLAEETMQEMINPAGKFFEKINEIQQKQIDMQKQMIQNQKEYQALTENKQVPQIEEAKIETPKIEEKPTLETSMMEEFEVEPEENIRDTSLNEDLPGFIDKEDK